MCGCKDTEKTITELVRSNIENALKQEQEAGVLHDYAIKACEILSAEEESSKKVHIIYDVVLGNADCAAMAVSVESLCLIEKSKERMVLSEWDNCWTLETDAHFLRRTKEAV